MSRARPLPKSKAVLRYLDQLATTVNDRGDLLRNCNCFLFSNIWNGYIKKKGSVVVMLRLSELGKVRNAEAEAE
jgi:hypothetical protein